MTAQSLSRPFAFDNSYARELEGLYVAWQPAKVPAPALVSFNEPLAAELGMDPAAHPPVELAAMLSGNAIPGGASPLAQAYAGHQFGGLSPQLGDGRAILLGEVVAGDGRRLDIQLKGAGRTPFARRGDGKATLGPMLREYLISEAMHALGVPTTRALAVVATGEEVERERALPGAILTRVASSHIRVGTFQFFALRRDAEKLQRLADYAIARHFPEVRDAAAPYLSLFEAVLEKQAELIAKWMLVGFVHGVMNTDNMAISGETIDYGPCAFVDRYEAGAVFSSIDENGRYAFGNQPTIAQWNLARFAETLIPLVDDDAEEAARLLTEVLNAFPHRYVAHWLAGMRHKLGLSTDDETDLDLVNSLFDAMNGQGVDYTLFFRHLATAVRGDSGPVRALFTDPAGFDVWMVEFEGRQRREERAPQSRAASMDQVNPLYIPRNHKVEEALTAAVDAGDYAPFHRLHEVLADPFNKRPGLEDFTQPAPAGFGPYVTFCGT